MTTAPAPQRLLSPTRRRIWNPYIQTRGGGVEIKKHADMTYACLLTAGWTVYAGPGRVDERGYLVPESDPSLRPEPPSIRG